LGKETKKSFKKIKRALTIAIAPSLVMLDMITPLFLYVYEKLTAVGVLTQLLAFWHCLVVYLSKKLDAVSPGWPPCLGTMVGTAILVAEASPLSFDSHEYNENY
jgi:hypothetical protein